MGATDGQRNFAEMPKTLGKPGFLSGEDRIRTLRSFSNVFWKFERYKNGILGGDSFRH
jgi:hypothetical protein